jgi:hypothetical protein
MTVTIYTGLVLATTSTGSSTLIDRGTYDEFKIKHEMPGVELDSKARTDVDIATQIITFNKGTDSGWHKHPGPVFITVVSGTMTFMTPMIAIAPPSSAPPARALLTSVYTRTKRKRIARHERRNVFRTVGALLRIEQTQPSNCPSFSTTP